MSDENEDLKRALREAYGLEDPTSSIPDNSSERLERMADRIENVWDFFMSKAGTLDRIMPDDD